MTKKKHLYEVDLMRCFFMFGVVLNHVTSTFAAALGNKDTAAGRVLVSTHLILHFPRFGFMFITGLVLFLSYYGRPEKQNWPQFWKKRYIGSGIPYLFWNGVFLAFLLLSSGTFSWNSWFTGWLDAISKGNQFYFYYIFLMFQLYLIFPLVLKLFDLFKNHLNLLLALSAVLQLGLMVWAKYFYPSMDHSSWPYLLKYYGNNIIFYQFYFILGGWAWCHYNQLTRWLLQNRGLVFKTTALTAVGTLLLYQFNVRALHLSQHSANLIHQPYMMVYAVTMIATIFTLCLLYAEKRSSWLEKKPAFIHWVDRSSAISFGVYLVHSISIVLLSNVLEQVQLNQWIILALLPLGYAACLGLTWLIADFLYMTPPFGRLIGRPNGRKLIARFKGEIS
ncbi:acyltransferase [Lactobacillus nasalidis]|uniref:Acyltransferase n=1 Tax=Lactobacillus nasalidis TaxID=2797258 RepID=A0ABQ3W5Q4_9LACO|nr:acyltransferase [Lactobacillus nasalidis]GHV96960.1 acyltransferase [Lactobacillus nasalidis]GHV99896.1 acyltransferase [Lactobacillus nasalidis]GHW00429.1 acyltransferase [Lactobacillus nasalidis]